MSVKQRHHKLGRIAALVVGTVALGALAIPTQPAQAQEIWAGTSVMVSASGSARRPRPTGTITITTIHIIGPITGLTITTRIDTAREA